jgi:hypothetical protein
VGSHKGGDETNIQTGGITMKYIILSNLGLILALSGVFSKAVWSKAVWF